MEHENDPEEEPTNWAGVIIKLIVGVIVLFIAAFLLVFGACLFG
ncbi:MAG: hypothetical protein ACR2QT_03025 [Woeseiaceae bacterium]